MLGKCARTPVLFSALPTVSAVALGQYSAVALLPGAYHPNRTLLQI